jgi:hypothetical protein
VLAKYFQAGGGEGEGVEPLAGEPAAAGDGSRIFHATLVDARFDLAIEDRVTDSATVDERGGPHAEARELAAEVRFRFV